MKKSKQQIKKENFWRTAREYTRKKDKNTKVEEKVKMCLRQTDTYTLLKKNMRKIEKFMLK